MTNIKKRDLKFIQHVCSEFIRCAETGYTGYWGASLDEDKKTVAAFLEKVEQSMPGPFILTASDLDFLSFILCGYNDCAEDGLTAPWGDNSDDDREHGDKLLANLKALPEPNFMLNRDGTMTGTILNLRSHHCSQAGCTGWRIAVRWPDGKKTFPCSKGCLQKGEHLWQIV